MMQRGLHGSVAEGEKRKLSKRKVRFIDLIRPEAIGESHIYIDIQLAFGVVQWMLRTGEKYRSMGQWGEMGVTELLCRQPTCCNFRHLHPFTSDWRTQLFDVFHHAILSGYAPPAARKWRNDFKVTPDGEAVVHFPHYDLYGGFGNFMSNHEASELVDSVFALGDRRFNFSPNECHPKAKWVSEAFLRVEPERYGIDLDYGYKNDSGWHRTMWSEKDEPLIDFLQRGVAKFETELEPIALKEAKAS